MRDESCEREKKTEGERRKKQWLLEREVVEECDGNERMIWEGRGRKRERE